MDALTVFSHGTIPQRAEKLQRHRYRLQAFHAAIGNHLAGRREILQYPPFRVREHWNSVE